MTRYWVDTWTFKKNLKFKKNKKTKKNLKKPRSDTHTTRGR